MTPQQIHLVQATWSRVLLMRDSAAQLFYAKLFELEPSLRGLFRSDMSQQGQKLVQVLDAAVNGLSRLDRLVPIIQDLGRRHVGYGVRDQHYAIVGGALLGTLQQALGDDFTVEVEEAWTQAYDTLAAVMREAAASVPA